MNDAAFKVPDPQCCNTLSESQKNAINSYLLKWMIAIAAFLGLPSMGAVVYAFAFLPSQVKDEAANKVRAQIIADADSFKKLYEEYGLLAGEAKRVKQQLPALSREVNDIRDTVASLRNADQQKVAALLGVIEAHPEASDIVQGIAGLSKRLGALTISDVKGLRESQLRVRQLAVDVAVAGLHPSHNFWPVTDNGLGTRTTQDVRTEPELGPIAARIAPQGMAFGSLVLAAWITPEVSLHEMVPLGDKSRPQLARLETRVVDKNRVVLIASNVGGTPGKVAAAPGCKLTVLFLDGVSDGQKAP